MISKIFKSKLTWMTLGTLGIGASALTTLACGEKRSDLSNVKTTDLGEFLITDNTNISHELLLERFNMKNHLTLTLDKDVTIQITHPTHQATITATNSSTTVRGSIVVNFEIVNQINLASRDITTELLEPFNDLPEENAILAEFNKTNQFNFRLITDVTVENIQVNQAQIVASPNTLRATGTTQVKFTLERKTIYVAENGKDQETTDTNLTDLKTTTIVQIGFNVENSAVTIPQMPKTIIKVPSQLPKAITSLEKAFQGATDFNDDLSGWTTTNVTNMSKMFEGATNFNQDISRWGVENVADMSWMFQNAKEFNQNLGSWDVSKVTNMEGMFRKASAFNNNNQPLAWNDKVKAVKSMKNMFEDATAFNQDLDSWDVSSVTTMFGMFYNAISFNNDDVAGGSNKPLAWNDKVQNVTDMSWMFSQATAFNQDISNWDVSKVENMRSMFVSAEKFNNGDVAGGSNKPLNWDGKVKNVTDMSFMFGGLKGAKSFNQNISGWDVSKVTKMNSMFQNAKQFSNGNKPLAWNDKVQNVTDMSWMFSQATAFNQDLGSWNVSNVTSMYYMFNSATAFNQDISNWDVSKVENMRSMFVSAEKFNNGDVAGGSNKPLNWDGKVKNVTDMSFMFGGLKGAKSFNQNISGWDVSKVTKMNSMFQNAKQFSNGNKPLAWNDKVQNVTDMSWMFSQATAFNQDISNWDVSKVENMRSMFSNATAFNNNGQSLASWANKLNKVKNMDDMFNNAQSCDLDLSSWKVPLITEMPRGFNTNSGITKLPQWGIR